uniref:Uncharacterized protein n=1 Tax=Physcomitrium patens TaxID=3218 RepID=A0A2K1KB20_PHYPA|nr:hypothetical protein PHYPA_010155 [Physcomitrium patens]
MSIKNILSFFYFIRWLIKVHCLFFSNRMILIVCNLMLLLYILKLSIFFIVQ